MAAHVLVPVALFAMVFGIVYLAITSSHREKMAMIEAGMHPEDSSAKKGNSLRLALLATFVGLGIFIGNMVGHYVPYFKPDSLGIVSAFFFGGIGLFIAYIIERKNEEKESF